MHSGITIICNSGIRVHFCINLQIWNQNPEFTKNEMIERSIFSHAILAMNTFRALCITGPRQSGKTTLSKRLLEGKPYFNFEDLGTQFEAEQNPREFLAKLPDGAIFDEVQRIPAMFRYLQPVLDSSNKRGQFILTGSNNFLLQEQISQSLAGRAGYLNLLPLSYAELQSAKLAPTKLLTLILTGGYPEIWQEELQPGLWHTSYIQTYVQRDVRAIRNISNLAVFHRFMMLCANQAGQIMNREDLARQLGVDSKTILAWIGLLESSFIAFSLQPWYGNLNKRVVKSPKLCFYDTGLLCRLLNITTEEELINHKNFGFIFENWVIAEIQKNQFNQGQSEHFYFFRDSVGNEVDVVIERGNTLLAIEIKANKKVKPDMFTGLKVWSKLKPESQCIMFHAGEDEEVLSEKLSVMPWKKIADL